MYFIVNDCLKDIAKHYNYLLAVSYMEAADYVMNGQTRGAFTKKCMVREAEA